MCLLMSGWSTRQHKIEFVVFAEVFNDLCPSRSVPQFFLASRAGMQNHVPARDFRIAPKRVSIFERRLRKLELRSGRNSTDAERLKQSQIVVDRVHIPNADCNQIRVNSGACLGLLADPVRSNPSART